MTNFKPTANTPLASNQESIPAPSALDSLQTTLPNLPTLSMRQIEREKVGRDESVFVGLLEPIDISKCTHAQLEVLMPAIWRARIEHETSGRTGYEAFSTTLALERAHSRFDRFLGDLITHKKDCSRSPSCADPKFTESPLFSVQDERLNALREIPIFATEYIVRKLCSVGDSTSSGLLEEWGKIVMSENLPAIAANFISMLRACAPETHSLAKESGVDTPNSVQLVSHYSRLSDEAKNMWDGWPQELSAMLPAELRPLALRASLEAGSVSSKWLEPLIPSDGIPNDLVSKFPSAVLHLGIGLKDKVLVEQALRAGAEVDSEGQDYRSADEIAVEVAIRSGCDDSIAVLRMVAGQVLSIPGAEAASKLVKHAMQPDLYNSDSPRRREEIVDVLITAGANVDQELVTAAIDSHLHVDSIKRFYLTYKHKRNDLVPQQELDSFLKNSLSRKNKDLVNYFISEGASYDKYTLPSKFLLGIVANRAEHVRANMASIDLNGYCPFDLGYSASRVHWLSVAIDLNNRWFNQAKEAPNLLAEFKKDNFSVIRSMLDAGASVDLTDDAGWELRLTGDQESGLRGLLYGYRRS